MMALELWIRYFQNTLEDFIHKISVLKWKKGNYEKTKSRK